MSGTFLNRVITKHFDVLTRKPYKRSNSRPLKGTCMPENHHHRKAESSPYARAPLYRYAPPQRIGIHLWGRGGGAIFGILAAGDCRTEGHVSADRRVDGPRLKSDRKPATLSR